MKNVPVDLSQVLATVQPEEPIEVIDEHGKRWLREGYCCRCGECCVGFDPFTISGKVCSQLHIESGKPASCLARHQPEGSVERKLYEEKCYGFPQRPSAMEGLPKCTYRFTPVD